jgi:hypothetical protein
MILAILYQSFLKWAGSIQKKKERGDKYKKDPCILKY